MSRNVYWLNESIENLSGSFFARVATSLCVFLLFFFAKKKILAFVLFGTGLASHLFTIPNSTSRGGNYRNTDVISINPPDWLLQDSKTEFIYFKGAEEEGIAGQWNKPLFLKSLCEANVTKSLILKDWDVVIYDLHNFLRSVWTVQSPGVVLYNGLINSGITSWQLPRDCNTVVDWANYRNSLTPELRDSYLADQLYLESNSSSKFRRIIAGFHRHCTSANIFRAICIERGFFVPVSLKDLILPPEFIIVLICNLLFFVMVKVLEVLRTNTLLELASSRAIEDFSRDISTFLSVGAAIFAFEANSVWARRKKSVVELVVSVFLLLHLDTSLKTIFGIKQMDHTELPS